MKEAASTASPSTSPRGMERAWLMATNFAMMYGWLRVLRLLIQGSGIVTGISFSDSKLSTSSIFCTEIVIPAVYLALALSFLEFVNAMIGMTKSKSHYVLLFSLVRYGVEHFISPMLPSCKSWPHLLTISAWSVGDSIRFGCFVLDLLVPGGRLAKSVRYTVGPLLFPIGAAGEMIMVIQAARYQKQPLLYVAAALWPLGFYPLMKQLLRQRKKFFARSGDEKKVIKSI